MTRALAILAAALTALLPAAPLLAAQKSKQEHVYGPAPTWDAYRALAEADIRGKLLDPESARITRTRGFLKSEYKPFLEPRVRGYLACGYVNAKNRMGGYTGPTTFVMVIDYGRVLFAEIDRSPTGMISQQCAAAVSAGSFPSLPVDTAAGAAPSDTPAATASGLTLRAMPDGAYIGAVAPGSAAAAAGLRPGMVIGSVNAVPLAGLGDAMLKVVDAAGAAASLTIVGGSTVKLGGGQ